jgi:hypothetical protein
VSLFYNAPNNKFLSGTFLQFTENSKWLRQMVLKNMSPISTLKCSFPFDQKFVTIVGTGLISTVIVEIGGLIFIRLASKYSLIVVCNEKSKKD